MTYPIARHTATDTINGRAVKHYQISRDGEPVRADWVAKAHAMLPDMLAPEDGTPPAAFTVLFRSGAGLHLNVYSWYWDNVLYAKFATGGVPVIGSPDEDPGNLVPLELPIIGCVYELGVLVHERSAWIRHMLGEAADMEGYLADVLPTGPIGMA